MTVVYILVGIVVVGVAGLLVASKFGRGSLYKRLFSDDHLLEVFNTIDDIAREAVVVANEAEDDADPPAAPGPDDDHAWRITSAGLAMHYTLTPIEGGAKHHISMSHPEGILAEAGARFLAGLVLLRLGVPPTEAAVRRSKQLVIHVAFAVNSRFVEDRAASPPPLFRREDLPEIREFVRDLCEQLDFAEIDVGAL